MNIHVSLSMDSPWISMDRNGYPWILVDIPSRCEMDSMDIHWISIFGMDIHFLCATVNFSFTKPGYLGYPDQISGYIIIWDIPVRPML